MIRVSLVLLALLAACTAPQKVTPAPEPVHFEGCGGLSHGASELPDVVLPCFTAGDQIRMGQLSGPLVINVWASWCLPCREELPAFQRLAESGKVPVLGINSGDGRDAALNAGHDLGVRFPMLFDRTDEFMRAVGEMGVPLTLFVGEQGKVTTYHGRALNDETLAALVRDRLGIT